MFDDASDDKTKIKRHRAVMKTTCHWTQVWSKTHKNAISSIIFHPYTCNCCRSFLLFFFLSVYMRMCMNIFVSVLLHFSYSGSFTFSLCFCILHYSLKFYFYFASTYAFDRINVLVTKIWDGITAVLRRKKCSIATVFLLSYLARGRKESVCVRERVQCIER